MKPTPLKLLLVLALSACLPGCNMLLQKPAAMPVNSPAHQAHADFTSNLLLP